MATARDLVRAKVRPLVRSPFGPQSGGVPTPTISWESDSSTPLPVFGFSASFHVGDVVTLERSNDNWATSDTATDTIDTVNPVNSLSFDFGGDWPDDDYKVRAKITRAAVDGAYSNVLDVTIAVGSAPVLSSPTASASGVGSVGATTDGDDGTLYAVLTTSATTPTAAQVKAGQDHTGAAAAWVKTSSVSSSGAKTISQVYGLAESTTYYAHLMHENAGAAQSNVVTSSSITTANNLLTKTQQFDNAAWTKSNTQVTANASTAPDGTTTADDLNANSTTNGLLRDIYVTGVSISSGQNYVLSAFVNPDEITKGILICDVTGGGLVRTWFDLTGSGSVLTNQNAAAGIDACDNGFYRIWCRKASTTTTAVIGFSLGTVDNDQTVTPAPTVGDGCQFWGVQLELGSSPTIYCAVA
jgi:hypothetical protein